MNDAFVCNCNNLLLGVSIQQNMVVLMHYCTIVCDCGIKNLVCVHGCVCFCFLFSNLCIWMTV